MTECELYLYDRNRNSYTKLKLSDSRGSVRWLTMPAAEEGYVKMEGKNSKLYYGSGKNQDKVFGVVINFSLYNHNKKLTYSLKRGEKYWNAEFREEEEFKLNTQTVDLSK